MVVNMFQQLLFLIIIINNAGMSLPCAPGEVTQPYTFTANLTQQNFIIRWHRDFINIASCTPDKCTLLGDENMYEATRSSQSTTLQIKNVTTQSGGIYTCEGVSELVFNCDFKVYAKPDSVTCQDPEFRAVTQDVAVACTVQRMYPNPVCRFSWFVNNTESGRIEKNLVEYNNLTGSGSSSYFNQNCSLSLPAKYFILGTHQFQLMAYPDVTGQDGDAGYGKNSTLTSPKVVVSPVVTLNCSDTTVQEDKQVSCTCTETANTFILATTTLFYGTANVSSALQHVTAPITGNRYTSEVICQAQLPEGTKTSKTQSLNVYYGPSNVSVRVLYNLAESDVISLCGQSLTATVTCSVPVNDVSPGVNYRFYSNVAAAPVALPNTATVNYTVTSGGVFYFQCTGKNTYFSSLSATSTEKITQVSEPPELPVIDKYQDGDTSFTVASGDGQLTVQEGLARIRCRVDGGYPPVSGLLLECGLRTNTSRDNNIYLDVNITRQMHGSNCFCTANHSSSCYRNNMATTVLDVHFASTIFSFDVNNTSGQIIIEKNFTVSISCQAEGNPSPSLSLRKNGTELQQFSDPTRKFNLTLSYTMTMSTCLDTGVYVCHAGNGQTTTNKTVTVYVKCRQQFTNADNMRQIYKGRVDGTLSISVSVFGYPEPIVTLNSSNYTLSVDAYSLTYIKQEPPYGTVSLMINIETARFFQNYSLNINNAEGQLTYSFEIVERDPEMSDPENQDVGAIVGGVVAAVLVIVVIAAAIFLLKRKGAPCKPKDHQHPNTSVDALKESDASGAPYKQKQDQLVNTIMETPYENDESVEAQAPESHHYEEIDIQTDVPDKPVYYTNQISNIPRADLEYQNTV